MCVVFETLVETSHQLSLRHDIVFSWANCYSPYTAHKMPSRAFIADEIAEPYVGDMRLSRLFVIV